MSELKPSANVPDLVPFLKKDLRQKVQADGAKGIDEFLQQHLSLERSMELLLEVVEAELMRNNKPAVVASALKKYRVVALDIQQRMTTSVRQSTDRDTLAPVAPPTMAPPKTIGRFIVIAKLGEGAFGAVYRARDPQLDREVAIKLPKRDAFTSPEERERFLREARAAAAIQHPNICPVHEVVADGDALYIVMAYVPGKSLADYLKDRKSPLSARQTAIMVRKLALALQASHAKGVIHRDLKPANILFDDQRKDVVITDFGLARRLAANDAELTRDGDVMGTPAYMAPEQARGDVKAIGPGADIYALGVILYELLTGTRPFQGTLEELLEQVRSTEPRPPAQVKPGVDEKLAAICLKALKKSPAERFASMKDLAAALTEYLKGIPAGAFSEKPQAGSTDSMQIGEVIAALNEDRKADTQQRNKLTRWLTVGLGCVGISVCFTGVALAVALWLFTRVGPDDGSKGGDLISVKLTNLTYINDNSVHYYLNGNKIDSAKLKDAIQVTIGEHELVAKRGNEVVERRNFRVGAEDNAKSIVLFLDEPEQPVGLIREMKLPFSAYSVAISPDGGRLLCSGMKNEGADVSMGSVSLWEISTGLKLSELPAQNVSQTAFAPRSGRAYWAASILRPKIIGLPFVLEYDLQDPKQWKDLRRFQSDKGGYYPITIHTNSDESRLLLTAISDTYAGPNAIVWKIDDGAVVARFDGCESGCFGTGPDDLFLSKGKYLTLHSLASLKREGLRSYEHTAIISCVACSRDGKQVAAGVREEPFAARIWDVGSGEVVQRLTGHTARISSIMFSSDGTRLLTASVDGTVRWWNVANGKQVYETPKQNGRILQACLTPGGRRAAFCCSDGTIKLWQLPK